MSLQLDYIEQTSSRLGLHAREGRFEPVSNATGIESGGSCIVFNGSCIVSRQSGVLS